MVGVDTALHAPIELWGLTLLGPGLALCGVEIRPSRAGRDADRTDAHETVVQNGRQGEERALRWNDGGHGKRFNAIGCRGRSKPHVAPYHRAQECAHKQPGTKGSCPTVPNFCDEWIGAIQLRVSLGQHPMEPMRSIL